jgi:hypothetical protein
MSKEKQKFFTGLGLIAGHFPLSSPNPREYRAFRLVMLPLSRS